MTSCDSHMTSHMTRKMLPDKYKYMLAEYIFYKSHLRQFIFDGKDFLR